MFNVEPRNIVSLVLDDGTCPFDDWLENLEDDFTVRRVLSRLTRIRDGNFGDHKSVGDGVYELRIPCGPGIRIYYGMEDSRIVVLILGGDKSSQVADIIKAKKLWRMYRK
jgi:putative addiction module killer protein